METWPPHRSETQRQSHPALFALLSFSLALGVGVLDYATGSETAVFVFYFVPVYLSIWHCRRIVSIILCAACSLSVVVADVPWARLDLLSTRLLWNIAVHLISLLVFAALNFRLKREVESEAELVRYLRESSAECSRMSGELARSNADLEQYAYQVAHDLKSPLVVIGGYVQMFLATQTDGLAEKGRALLQHSLEGVRRMEELVDNLLEFARVGSDEGAFEQIDCNAALRCALEDLGLDAEDRQVAVGSDPLPTISANPGQVVELLRNLIDNAIKYRGTDPPAVHVSAWQEDSQWVFKVQDNGVGMDPSETERIFRMFERLSRNGGVPGTGIGLAICKKIVERNGGRIWAESSPGNGSSFYFTWPIAEPDASTPPSPSLGDTSGPRAALSG